MSSPDTESAEVPRYHTIGVGAGPANLSLAALFAGRAGADGAVRQAARARAGTRSCCTPGVRMQTSWVKDLVSLVDPRHPLTFLSTTWSPPAGSTRCSTPSTTSSRGRSTCAYLAWAAEQLPDLHYGVAVERVSFDESTGFTAHSGGRPVGPLRPPRGRPGHASRSSRSGSPGCRRRTSSSPTTSARGRTAMDRMAPVAVVGGGQTGAECVLELLATGFSDIHWFGRRPWFSPLDDSPPANDFYRPAYLRFLQGLRRGRPPGAGRGADADRRRDLARLAEVDLPGQLRGHAGDRGLPGDALPGPGRGGRPADPGGRLRPARPRHQGPRAAADALHRAGHRPAQRRRCPSTRSWPTGSSSTTATWSSTRTTRSAGRARTGTRSSPRTAPATPTACSTPT